MNIARLLDTPTTSKDLSLSVSRTLLLGDFTAIVIDHTKTTAKISRLARVPKTPPMQAPSDKTSRLDDCTANTATVFCRIPRARTKNQRFWLSVNTRRGSDTSVPL